MDNNNVKYLIEQAAQRQEPVKIDGHHPVMLKHEDIYIEGMEKHAEKPYRISQTESFGTAKAFIQYVNDFSGDNTRLFGNPQERHLLAVFDYHGKDGVPSFCSHKAKLELKRDNDLSQWLQRDGDGFSQQGFVRFLVDYAGMVKDATYATGAEPKPINAAEFMELVGSIKSIKTEDLQGAASVNGNVEMKLAMSHKVKAGGGKELPERISVGLPIFRGGDSYHFDFRIMVSVEDGHARYSFKLIRPEAVIEQAFNDVLKEVQDELNDGLKIYGL